MRSLLCAALFVGVAACSSSKPAATPAPDLPTPAASADMPPAPSTADTTASPASSAPAMPTAVEPPPPAPPKLEAQGQAGGKPFAPTVAYATLGPQNVATVTLRQAGAACSAIDDGERVLTLYVPWQEGSSSDVSEKFDASGGGKKPVMTPRSSLSEVKTAGGKTQSKPVAGFTPKGTARVLASPKASGQRGRMSFDLTAGGYTLKGETLVQVCAAPAAG